MIKILFNNCIGGFSFSNKAKKLYCTKGGVWSEWDLVRHNPILIECFEELGLEFNARCSSVGIIEISIKYIDYYYIHNNDGYETIVIDHIKYDQDTGNSNEDVIEILLNNCYGRFNISTNAEKLYNLKKLEIDPTFKYVTCFNNIIYRTDPILILCFKELGSDFNASYTNIHITLIPVKYKEYFSILDYDGIESINITPYNNKDH